MKKHLLLFMSVALFATTKTMHQTNLLPVTLKQLTLQAHVEYKKVEMESPKQYVEQSQKNLEILDKMLDALSKIGSQYQPLIEEHHTIFHDSYKSHLSAYYKQDETALRVVFVDINVQLHVLADQVDGLKI